MERKWFKWKNGEKLDARKGRLGLEKNGWKVEWMEGNRGKKMEELRYEKRKERKV